MLISLVKNYKVGVDVKSMSIDPGCDGVEMSNHIHTAILNTAMSADISFTISVCTSRCHIHDAGTVFLN